jgi:hypothetical protein
LQSAESGRFFLPSAARATRMQRMTRLRPHSRVPSRRVTIG